MSKPSLPLPAPLVAAMPPSRPFIGPEELTRRSGRSDLVRLGANESAFGPSPQALEAMQRELRRASWYGDPESLELREALAARHGCEPTNVTVAAGIDDLLGLAVRAYLAPGDVTVATLGSYPTYVYHVAGYGARLEPVPYAPDGSVQVDALARLARAAGARVVYLANPDNPSGTFASAPDVARLARSLPPGCLLILDEAYGDFVAPAELVPDRTEPHVLRMRTFSKAYGLAGVRIAYSVGAPEIAAAFAKIRLQYGVNRPAQAGALAALRDTEFVAGVVAEVERGREEYRALAAEAGLRTLASRTNFVCIEIGSRERAERMVAELLARGIFVRKPGAAPIDGCIRVTVGTPAERVRFAAAFREALAVLDEKVAVG